MDDSIITNTIPHLKFHDQHTLRLVCKKWKNFITSHGKCNPCKYDMRIKVFYWASASEREAQGDFKLVPGKAPSYYQKSKYTGFLIRRCLIVEEGKLILKDREQLISEIQSLFSRFTENPKSTFVRLRPPLPKDFHDIFLHGNKDYSDDFVIRTPENSVRFMMCKRKFLVRLHKHPPSLMSTRRGGMSKTEFKDYCDRVGRIRELVMAQFVHTHNIFVANGSVWPKKGDKEEGEEEEESEDESEEKGKESDESDDEEDVTLKSRRNKWIEGKFANLDVEEPGKKGKDESSDSEKSDFSSDGGNDEKERSDESEGVESGEEESEEVDPNEKKRRKVE